MMHFAKDSGSNTTHIGVARIAICFGLCLALTVSMTGCIFGGKKDAVDTVTKDTPYFAMEELEFYEIEEGEQVYVYSMTAVGDQVAVLIQVSNYYDMMPFYEYASDISLSSSRSAPDPDAEKKALLEETEVETDTDENTVIDENVEEKIEIVEEPGYYGGSVRYIILMYSITGELISQIELGDVLGVNDSVSNLSVNQEGQCVLLVQSFDQNTYAQTNKLYTFDAEGNLDGEPVVIQFDDEYFYPNKLIIDASGRLYFSGYGMESGMIIVMDEEGNTDFEIKDNSLSGGMYYHNGIVYADGYNMEGSDYKVFLYPIDPDSDDHLGEPMDVTKLFMMTPPFAGADGIYVNSASGIFSVDLESQEKEEVLLWKHTDIDKGVYAFGTPVVVSKDTIFLQGNIYTQETSDTKIALLTRQDENPNAGKKIVNVAGINVAWDQNMQTGVYEFNKESKDYRIEITDYAEDFDYSGMNSYEDYLAALSEMNKKMYMEMLSGDGPDVIYGTQGMSFSQYESKGLLVDFYTLMANDSSFAKDDYMKSILTLCETNGKLNKMPTSFMLQGFAGAKAVIGDRTGWTVDEFNEMVNSLPSGVIPLANHTQEQLLTLSLSASMAAFVDVESGKVNFDSEEFRQLLDMAKTYGTVDTGEEPNYENYVDEWTLVQNGDLALMTCHISNPSSYDQMTTLFGEDVSIVGYPSSTKSGPMCQAIASFSISSESNVQDGAWSFVKTFFSEEYQNKVLDSGWGIPIMTSVFEEQIDRAVNPPEYDDDYPIAYDRGYYGNEPMSEASAQAYRELINSVDTLLSSDQQILSIIMEEVPAYFGGQKSDKAVAELIQNRVQTLVNERQ